LNSIELGGATPLEYSRLDTDVREHRYGRGVRDLDGPPERSGINDRVIRPEPQHRDVLVLGDCSGALSEPDHRDHGEIHVADLRAYADQLVHDAFADGFVVVLALNDQTTFIPRRMARYDVQRLTGSATLAPFRRSLPDLLPPEVGQHDRSQPLVGSTTIVGNEPEQGFVELFDFVPRRHADGRSVD
jgi:hypothetical protein